MRKGHAKKLTGKAIYHLKRLFPAYILCFIPFLVAGTWSDIRLMLWKVAVVGAGLLVFHHARKSMFPYIDLARAFDDARSAGEKERVATVLLAVAQAIVVSAMSFAVIFSVAGGM